MTTNLSSQSQVICDGNTLSIAGVVAVSRRSASTSISDDKAIRDRIHKVCDYLLHAVDTGKPIYGVTTGVGANATSVIPREDVDALQNDLLWLLKTGAGKLIPRDAVRAGMLLRLNSLVRGVSGVRMELLERLVAFLNAGLTPQVREFGSIGASGDLVPLAAIAGAISGVEVCKVDLENETLSATDALASLNLEPLPLRAKEGLALCNGTSVMTGMAALALHDTRRLVKLSHAAHALAIQAFNGSEESFEIFIHQHKPHAGQIQSAQWMRALLKDSKMTVEGMKGHFQHEGHVLIQDRYSLRCLPQYMSPILDGLTFLEKQIEIEINSANDNPLLDVDSERAFNGGNFLGQVIGVGMDQLRSYIGLLAKHLDTQVSLLMAPEFSNGLPMALSGAPDRSINMGLKGMQLLGNSIMPTLTFLGNTLSDRYPTHAEQFNQNINSQGYASANLARQSVQTMCQYMAVPLMMGVQAVDLRARLLTGKPDARETLSPATLAVYEAVYELAATEMGSEKPFMPTDDDRPLEWDIEAIATDLQDDGKLDRALDL